MALGCMEHRGACSADNDSGDGAGIMSQIPWQLLSAEFSGLNTATTGCALIAAAYLTRCRFARWQY